MELTLWWERQTDKHVREFQEGTRAVKRKREEELSASGGTVNLGDSNGTRHFAGVDLVAGAI